VARLLLFAAGLAFLLGLQQFDRAESATYPGGPLAARALVAVLVASPSLLRRRRSFVIWATVDFFVLCSASASALLFSGSRVGLYLGPCIFVILIALALAKPRR